jgi:hypothetical protein
MSLLSEIIVSRKKKKEVLWVSSPFGSTQAVAGV